ncbi:unnamed protein product [Pleuronectes platessa]|uniref:Uncharacterized protein n=1 Tax=Pleuronectes platessa TaxID=8262 RepID=A0A9N7YVS4_PLEPL|nr:unnamed protein product [Pleuronectes platessa]
MDNKSKKNARVALRSIGEKAEVSGGGGCYMCKLTDLFGAGFTSPAAAGAPGDERGGLDNDERVEADMSTPGEKPPAEPDSVWSAICLDRLGEWRKNGEERWLQTEAHN